MRLITLLSLFTLLSQSAFAVININNGDAASEGFNDITASNPVGGNAANTLGQARLNAFRHAALLMDAMVSSAVPIEIDAEMNSIPGNPPFVTLGGAAPINGFINTPNAPVADTIYVVALANALAGMDLDATESDIVAEFNSDVDGDVVLGSLRWYYGYTPSSNPALDFATVVKHEIIHGLGFFTPMNSSGQLLGGYNDAYMLHLEDHDGTPTDFPSMTDAQRAAAMIDDGNLHWTGFNVRTSASMLSSGRTGNHAHMYAPITYESGSSVSHFDIALDPDELMEPLITASPQMVLAAALLEDIGWTIANANPSVAQADLMLALTQSSSVLDTSGVAHADAEITITNQSGNTASHSTMTLVLPEGFILTAYTPSQGSCVELERLLRCNLGTLTGSATATIDVSATTRYKGTHDLVFNVSSPHLDSNVIDNTDSMVVIGVDPGFPYSGSGGPGGVGGMGLLLIGLLPLLIRRKLSIH